MTIISVKGGNSQEILDGSQDTLSLLAITTGTGLIHVGDPSPAGFDVPFRGGDQIILPANEPATLRADGFIVTGSIGAYGGQVYSGGGTPEPFWEPFTITAGDLTNDALGYSDGEGGQGIPATGSISNQPVEGYSLSVAANVSDPGIFVLAIRGPAPMRDLLIDAVIGIGEESFILSRIGDISVARLDDGFETIVQMDGFSQEWMVGQQVPIVVIPQNG